MEAKPARALFGLVFLCAITTGSAKQVLVAFWGQNSAGPQHQSNQEQELGVVCNNRKYDVIVISYLDSFFDSRNKGDLPGFNLASHCTTPHSSQYPTLLKCPAIETAIGQCQQNGKKVLLGIGGTTADATFPSPAKAREFAQTVWDLLLGGTGRESFRPFGQAILDGIVMDFQGGRPGYYSAFVRETKRLMMSSSRHYTIQAAVSSTYPDYYLGPGSSTLLTEVPDMIDMLYIKHFDTPTKADNSAGFWQNIQQWKTGVPGPALLIGLPSHASATSQAASYRTPAQVQTIYNVLTNNPRFGGFMLWDASWDQSNVINGELYSKHLDDMMPSSRTTRTTTTAAPTTTAPPRPPGGVSCIGLSDGMHPHPTECSKYIICAGGVPQVHDCPPGLLFNSQISNCDFAANVSC